MTGDRRDGPSWEQLLVGPGHADGVRWAGPRHARALDMAAAGAPPAPAMGWGEAAGWTVVAAGGALAAARWLGDLVR